MSKKDRGKILLIGFITFIISIYLIFHIVTIIEYRSGSPNDIIYKAQIDGDINYDVYLKTNPFITEEYLPKGLSYITSLVEYLKTTFTYKFTGNSNTTINYDYWIQANVISEYVDDTSKQVLTPIWNKTFILLDHQIGTLSNSTIKVNRQLNIGLDYYNKLINDFVTNLNIPIDSRLEITFYININGSLPNNKSLIKKHSISMTIPLGVKAFNINLYKSFANEEITYNKKQSGIEKSYVIAIIYIILTIAIIYIGIQLIRRLLLKRYNKYQLKIDDILKEYDDRIVTVSNFINYDELDIVEVSSFEELLNLSDETLEPIIYWEKRGHNNREAWFAILRERVLYLYVISYNIKD